MSVCVEWSYSGGGIIRRAKVICRQTFKHLTQGRINFRDKINNLKNRQLELALEMKPKETAVLDVLQNNEKGLRPILKHLFKSSKSRTRISEKGVRNLLEMLPSRMFFRRGLKENRAFMESLRKLLRHSIAVEYLPLNLAKKINFLITHPRVLKPENLLVALRYLPDTPEAKKFFEEDLDRFIEELKSSGRTDLRFREDFVTRGTSQVGVPVLRTKESPLPWNTIRVLAQDGAEDWSNPQHIDFSRYEKNEMHLRSKGSLAHLAEKQTVQKVDLVMPKEMKEQYKDFLERAKKFSEQEVGFVFVRLLNGASFSVNIKGGKNHISAEEILTKLDTIEQRAPIDAIDIFHSHPNKEGIVTTSLSIGDKAFIQALSAVISRELRVRIHATPLSIIDQGVIFSSEPF